MSNYINPASNISYTNRDFATVYPELLNLTKELTSRWDPSVANESDPGLVLLKLDAILADKLSYNIDKNILEAFPMSLTQMSSAQRLYSILGYNMHWYNSAWTTVNLQWTGTASDDYVTIPAFTMVTDDAGSIVYTLIGAAKGNYEDTEITPSDVDLYFKNDTINKFYAYQGIATKHDIHGDNIIRITDLDSNNRIYLGTTNIAQNGVFICNTTETGTKSYDWTRVDNLVVEKLGEKHFQFGVSDDLYSCYLEFPEDAENLIKDGIEIVYLQTMGESGNIAATKLTKFYADLYLTSKVNETTVSLNSNNMVISNTIAGTGGQDPETINEAYKNYRRTVGTFNTLVTLRDYINAALQSGLCSNCFICDKTNDVQTTYDVKSIINGVDTTETIVEATQATVTGIDVETGQQATIMVDKAALSSVDLKIYALEPHEGTDKITTMVEFLNTFELQEDTTKLKSYLSSDSNKHIGNDFQEIVSTTYDSAHPCLFKNAYIITARVQCKKTGLTDSDKEEIKKNIQTAFYNNLNASCLEFGESIATDLVTSVIQNADTRIKSVYVDTIAYDTVAVIYYETATCPFCASSIRSDELIRANYRCPHCNEPISSAIWNSLPDRVAHTAEIPISQDSIDYVTNYGCDYYSSTKSYKVGDFVLTASGERKICLKDDTKYLVDSCWKTDEYAFTIDYDKFTKKIEGTKPGQLNYGTRIQLRTALSGTNIVWEIYTGSSWTVISDADLSAQYGITKTAGTLYFDNTGVTPRLDTILFEIGKGTQIRDEVYAKSILAGKTPLFKTDEEYIDYNFPNPFCETISDVAEIEAIADVTFSRQSTTPFLYDMRANEVAEFYNTQFNEFINYSNYVKYEAKLDQGSDIVPNQDRELGSDEYVIFYYKNTNNSGELYQYHAYGKGAILNSSFTISSTSTHAIGDLIVPSSISGWKSTTVAGFTYIEVGSDITRSLSTSESTMIEGLTSQIIKGTNSVSMKQPSQVALNGSAYCYWILNSVQNGAFVLFDSGETHRTLQNGEYFLYADSSLSEINVFGQGTTIVRSDPTNRIDCPVGLSYEELIDSSLILYTDMFVHPEASDPLICQTNDVAYMSYGCTVKLQLKEVGGQVNTTIDKLIVSHDGIRCELKYTATGTSTLSIVENPENGNITEVLVNGTAHTSWTYEHGTEAATTGTLIFTSSVPASGDTIIIHVSENLLKYFKIQYRNSAEAEWSELTDISLTGSNAQFGWNALSVLNINIGQSVGQALYSGQTVNLYSSDGKSLRTYVGQDSVVQPVPAINDGTRLSLKYTYNQLPVKIYSDLPIMTSSSGRYSIVTQEQAYAHISQTKQNFTSVPTQMSPLLNGGVTLTIKAAAAGQSQCNTVICPAQFDAGNYLAKVSNASKNFSTLNGQFVSNFEYLQSESSTQAVFYLTHTPTSLAGVKVNNTATTEWVYSRTAGTLTFKEGHIPAQGSIVEVEYTEKYNIQLTQVETGTKKIFAVNDNPPSVTMVYVNNSVVSSGWSYSNVTHKLTFTSELAADAVVRIQYPIANLSIIYNGEQNLSGCNNTPVKFTIPSIYSGKEIFLQMSATFLAETEMVDNATIVVGNPQRYIYNPEIPENRVDSYEALVRKLDVNQHFNYTYEPTENEIIRNPLSSSSFLNANHPYYSNTICEYIGDAQTNIDVQENK